MKAWAVVAHGEPLECVELPDPTPIGTEIVVEVTHCGVCHSDLHLWHGGYDLGGGKILSVADRGLVLPAARQVTKLLVASPNLARTQSALLSAIFGWFIHGSGAANANIASLKRTIFAPRSAVWALV